MKRDQNPAGAREGAPAGEKQTRRTPRPAGIALAAVLSVAALVAALFAVGPAAARPAAAAAAQSMLSTQRGPDPTIQSVEASRGPFATAQLSVAPGNGFNGGAVYYPTDTSLGTWGALVIIPGYTARCVNQPAPEEAWMGPWLSSFGFVVLCMETNSPNDFDATRGQEALAALNWLTTASPVRSRVDPNRLSVMGHSMGGGGVVYATEHQPALRAGIGLAPFSPSQNFSSEKVPTLVLGGQYDPTVTPSALADLYRTMPSSTQSAFAQIAGADHEFYRTQNNVMMKLVIPWLKIFVDGDSRYTQFLCPRLPDPSTISQYQPKCPYTPPGGWPSTSSSSSSSSSTSTSTSTSSSSSTSTPPPGACTAVYQTANSWPGGFQGLVTVTAGSSANNGWTVKWTLGSGQAITQLWSGDLATSGSAVTVHNLSYNGALAAGASTTFGFLADGAPSTPALTCTSP